MTPLQLLQLQEDLYQYLRYPAEETCQFYDKLYDALELGARPGARPGALHPDEDMARFSRSTWISWFYPASRGRELLPMLRKALYATPAYQVEPKIVDAVTGMYRKTSLAQTVSFSAADLPAPSGFLWLDKAIFMTDIGGDKKSTRAVSWSPVTVRSAETSIHGDGIRFTTWSLLSDEGAWGMTSLPGSPLQLSSSQITPFGQELKRVNMQLKNGKLEQTFDGEATDDILYWVQTLWMFMGTEVTSVSPAKVHKQSARKIHQVTANKRVNVVLLRRVTQTDREHGHRPVDWTCSWVVQAFWRHLPGYVGPAKPHQAKVTGAEQVCAVCEWPVTRVRAHVKDPAGLPLKVVPETVYKVSR